MLHSKLLKMRLGATSIISSANRWQFVIETSANGSISAASCNQRRYHHMLKAQPTINFSEIRHANERSYSICSKKHSTNDGSNSASSRLRTISSNEITKHITLLTKQQENAEVDSNSLKLKTQLEKPLAVLLQWLMAKPAHVKKYAQLYIDQGFDVITVSVSPWQVMWPTKGIQLIAAEVLQFLTSNVSKKTPLVLHGFSVGGYLWGECLVHMSRDVERYRQVLDQVQGQVWDSAVELSEIPLGVPKAVFPTNDTLQRALKNYLTYHMKTFHEPATAHYIRASQMFHSTLVKKPALLLLSNNDPIASVSANKVLKQSFESLGIRTEWKCWEKSPHVAHFQKYREDYINVLYAFLQSINMMQREQEAMQARI